MVQLYRQLTTEQEMAEQAVNIYNPDGNKVGYFKSPKLEMLPEHHYEITGEFYSPEGERYGKVEFNPEVLPYTADISMISKCGHEKLVRVYVMRGRQPISMTGVCPHVPVPKRAF
jgi:hypothetical protein